MLKRLLSSIVIACFLTTSVSPLSRAHADSLGLPTPGAMINLSSAYEPVMIKGLKVHANNPFLFDFLIDTGDSRLTASDPQLKEESNTLIKYFLAAMTVPEGDLWVNLSPYEKNRMIADNLGQTQMGRDMLAEDYILKQLTASLIYPEKDLGKKFWDTVYAKARQMYGTTQIPVNTFNKVWIVADKADVFERKDTAYVVGAHLKVMLEEDYLALQKHGVIASEAKQSFNKIATSPSAPRNDTSSLGSNIVRSIVLPQLEKEVNQGKNFAALRQMFYSMILASWYKTALKNALLSQIYADQSKVKVGINQQDPKANEAIFQRYLQAYKKGVFNYIKEEVSPPLDGEGQGGVTTRKYFSGGLQMNVDHAMRVFQQIPAEDSAAPRGKILDENVNMAMTSKALTLDDFNQPMRETVEALVKQFGWNMANVQVLDKAHDKQRLIEEELTQGQKTGRFIQLTDGNYYAQSHPKDVQRAPPRTMVSTNDRNDKGLHNNWGGGGEAPLVEDKLRAKIIKLMQSDAKPTDTVYVLPYLRGPKGSPFSTVGVQITTDRQVALQIMTLYKVGGDAIEQLEQLDPTYFTKGANIPGDLDEIWSIIGKGGPDGRHFAAFLNAREFLSRGSAYGGNAILPKKFELRQGMWDSVEAILKKGRVILSEHMFILQITEKKTGRKFNILGAFPSNAGKTNMGMIELPDELKDEYEAQLISDDLAGIFQATDPNIYSPEELGHLFAINFEDAIFGVIFGTGWRSNSALMKALKPNSGIIFTNVAVNRKLRQVWWEDKTEGFPPYDENAQYWEDWKGDRIIDRVATEAEVQAKYGDQKKLADLTPAELWDLKAAKKDPDPKNKDKYNWAHANSRASVPMTNIDNLSPDFHNPKGVRVDAFLWGGKSDNHPLFYIPYDAVEGITDGTSAAAKSTAAAEGKVGVLDADPNAQRPFFGPPEGRYFSAWLRANEIVADKMPVFAHINQIQPDWPGFGKNGHVLRLLIEFIKGDRDSFGKTALGFIPKEDAFDLKYFVNPKTKAPLTSDELKKILGYDPYHWLFQEMPRREAYYDKIDAVSPKDKVPQALRDKNKEIEERLKNEITAIELGQIQQALLPHPGLFIKDDHLSIALLAKNAVQLNQPFLKTTLSAITEALRLAGLQDTFAIDTISTGSGDSLILSAPINISIDDFTSAVEKLRASLAELKALASLKATLAPALTEEFRKLSSPRGDSNANQAMRSGDPNRTDMTIITNIANAYYRHYGDTTGFTDEVSTVLPAAMGRSLYMRVMKPKEIAELKSKFVFVNGFDQSGQKYVLSEKALDELLAKFKKDKLWGRYLDVGRKFGYIFIGGIGNFISIIKLSEPLRENGTTSPSNAAMIGQASVANALPRATPEGGIDLTRANAQINLHKEGQGVDMQFDSAMVERIRQEGFDGLEFRIQSIKPVDNLSVLLGIV